MTVRSIIASSTVALTAVLPLTAWGAPHLVVDQFRMQFSETQLLLKHGNKVTFHNNDHTSHNIQVSGPIKFDGGLQKPGENIDVLISKPGTYSVTCAIHPKMHMTIIAN
jgi:plastocyanin